MTSRYIATSLHRYIATSLHRYIAISLLLFFCFSRPSNYTQLTTVQGFKLPFSLWSVVLAVQGLIRPCLAGGRCGATPPALSTAWHRGLIPPCVTSFCFEYVMTNVIPFDPVLRSGERSNRIKKSALGVKVAMSISVRPDLDVDIANIPLDITIGEFNDLCFDIFDALMDFAKREGYLS